MFGGAVFWFAAGIGDSFHTRGVFLTVRVIMMAMAAMPLDLSANPYGCEPYIYIVIMVKMGVSP